jgi:PAS domain S-box-containing protein
MTGSPLTVLLVGDDSLSGETEWTFADEDETARVLEADDAATVTTRLEEDDVDCVTRVDQVDAFNVLDAVRAVDATVPVVLAEEVRDTETLASDVCELVEDADSDLLLATRSPGGDWREVTTTDDYERLIEHSSEPLYVLDRDGRFKLVNPAMSETLGLAWDDIVDHSIGEFMSGEEFERFSNAIDATGATDRDGPVTVDVVVETSERTRVYENALTSIDDERVAGVVHDVTTERRRVEELSELTRKIEDLHAVASMLQSCKTEGEIYDLSLEAAEEILNFDWCAMAIVQEGWFELVRVSEDAPIEEGSRHLKADEGQAGKAFQTGEPMVSEDVQSNDVSSPIDPSFRSGLSVPVEGVGVLEGVSTERGAFDEDDVEVAELLAANIREAISRVRREQQLREQQSELERQNEQLEEFASVVSHDLRNPLDVAMGQLEVAIEKQEEENPHVELALRAIHRTEELIDDVLTLARQGRQIDKKEPVLLRTVVEDAWIGHETDATLDIVDDLGTIMGDSSRLYEVFGNLFRNAIEHGSDDVSVTLGRLDDGFYVEDDGPGIDKSSREHVFESGFTTSESGTGFGLTIVQEIAQAHGWDVSLTDGTEGGARFEFRDVEFP